MRAMSNSRKRILALGILAAVAAVVGGILFGNASPDARLVGGGFLLFAACFPLALALMPRGEHSLGGGIRLLLGLTSVGLFIGAFLTVDKVDGAGFAATLFALAVAVATPLALLIVWTVRCRAVGYFVTVLLILPLCGCVTLAASIIGAFAGFLVSAFLVLLACALVYYIGKYHWSDDTPHRYRIRLHSGEYLNHAYGDVYTDREGRSYRLSPDGNRLMPLD